MSERPKLNAQQTEAMLKLMLLQQKAVLQRLQEIESLPNDGSVDKLALMREALGQTGAKG